MTTNRHYICTTWNNFRNFYFFIISDIIKTWYHYDKMDRDDNSLQKRIIIFGHDSVQVIKD